jgi:hypothetical protein
MTPDQHLAELAEAFPGWHIWRGRDRRGRPEGWYATQRGAGARAAIVPANGPAELRHRLLETLTSEAVSH